MARICAIATILLCCFTAACVTGNNQKFSETEIASASAVISDYVREKYGWATHEFKVMPSNYDDAPDYCMEFEATHEDDKNIYLPDGGYRLGGGKSRSIRIDMHDMRILHDLAFQ